MAAAGSAAASTSHEMITSHMALETGAEVISVHYRRPPENPYPAAFDDCLYVVQWAIDNQARLGIDGARVAVAGDSAGGNLAAAIAIAARDSGGPAMKAQALDLSGGRCGPEPAELSRRARSLPAARQHDLLPQRLSAGPPRHRRSPRHADAGEDDGRACRRPMCWPPITTCCWMKRWTMHGGCLRAAWRPNCGWSPGAMHGFLRARAYSELARREFTLLCEWLKDRLMT